MKRYITILIGGFIGAFTVIWLFIDPITGIISFSSYGIWGYIALLAMSLILALFSTLIKVISDQSKKNNIPISKLKLSIQDTIWDSRIYNDKNKMVKSDEWLFNIDEDFRLYGTIKRNIPIEDNKREWCFSGFLFHDQMLLAFAQQELEGRSSGCVLVHKSLDEDYMYSGYYYKFNEGKLEPNRIKIELIKRRNK